MKDELLLQQKKQSSKNYNFTSEATFEYVFLYLVLSSFLNYIKLRALNTYNLLFVHLYKIIKSIKLEYIYNLFKYNLNYAS